MNEEGLGLEPNYQTPLHPAQEAQFWDWVQKNRIPFVDEPKSDYDMRGFWLAQQQGDPNAVRSLMNQHFPDTYKTPYHKSFSNESIYASPNAPHWVGSTLVDNSGNVVFDETAKKK